MGFYAMFERLCSEKGVSPAQVRADLGISQSTMASWKSRGLTPRYDTLRKLADYFRVDVDDLLVENWGIKAGGKIKAGGGIKSRYGIEAGEGIEAGGPVEVGPGAFNDSSVRNIVFNATPDPEWVDLETKLKNGTITPKEWQRYKDLNTIMAENTHRAVEDAKLRLQKIMEQLNDAGQQKVVERAEELTEIPRYRAETAPQSPPAPQEGQSTTPPPDAPETPPGGK